MDKELRAQIKDIMQHEVVPATGCTEPGAVALCVAKAVETLGLGDRKDCEPVHITLHLSKNVFKNAMGVGIPGTGMIGLPIAVAMAVTHGDSKRGLEVLTMPEAQVEDAKQWLANNADSITIDVKEDGDKLYIECLAEAKGHTATAVIAKRHTNFVHVEHDGKVVFSQQQGVMVDEKQDDAAGQLQLTARMVYDYATTAPLDELEWLRETVVYNNAASECGLVGMGLHTGQILMEQARGDMVHTVVARTVAASDARMDGCTRPVYSNSGSGNQGICCTLPVYYYGKLKGNTDEQILRALTMSHLMSIYIKRGIGRLSALCGIVNATMGVSAALTYLEVCGANAAPDGNAGSFEQVGFALKNMINTIAGMVCDGAKPSCALKMSVGLYSAFVCSELAVHRRVVDSTDGLSESDLDCSIRNLGRLGKDGMNQTDDMILDIMTHKK